MERKFIQDFSLGVTYTVLLAVTKKQTRTTKNDKPYLVLDLADKTGKLTARMWEEIPLEMKWSDVLPDKVYEIEGKVEEYQGLRQMIINHIYPVTDFDRKDFLPSIEENPEELWKEFREIQAKIKDAKIKELVDSMFEDTEFANKFKVAPAAKAIHDSVLGGLLRHTLRMLKLSIQIIDFYPDMPINRDLVIAGVSFHDMEKVHEYTYDGVSIEYSDTGHFVGHTVMAMNMLYHKIRGIKDFPKDTEDQILHIVAAHAGEYDPIRLPSTLEANLVHLVDFLDSRLVHFKQEMDSAEEGQRWKKDFYGQAWMFFGNQNKISGENESKEQLF